MENFTLKGLVGNTGVARGKVKLILNPEDFSLMEKGDVAVLQESTAAIIHLVSKAAAIITDHGGITSHAAIISREHHIPCIVGVQTATQALHDGDQVVVDADAGTISLINQ